MKVYFSGSIMGGRELVATYRRIVDFLNEKGFTVLSEHVASSTITKEGEKKDPIYKYERDIKYLNICDIVVAETTMPSLGVGFEIAYAQQLGKKVICLFNSNSEHCLSAMVAGNNNIKLIKYKNLEEAEKVLYSVLKDFFPNK